MKTAFVLALALLLTTGFVHAQKADKAKTATTEKTSLICPVTGEDADSDVSYAYNGKTYYFCCEGCVKKFKKDPAKYIKASAKNSFDKCNDHPSEEATGANHEMHTDADKAHAVEAAQVEGSTLEAAVINTGRNLSEQIVNTKCPVMGEAVDKKVTTVTYKDKVYGFCCKGCIKKFAANPEKYLNKN